MYEVGSECSHLRCFGQVRVPTAVIGTPSAGVKEVTTGKEVRRGFGGARSALLGGAGRAQAKSDLRSGTK